MYEISARPMTNKTHMDQKNLTESKNAYRSIGLLRLWLDNFNSIQHIIVTGHSINMMVSSPLRLFNICTHRLHMIRTLYTDQMYSTNELMGTNYICHGSQHCPIFCHSNSNSCKTVNTAMSHTDNYITRCMT